MIKVAIIVKEDGKYLVKTEDGSRTLGTHDNRRDAEIQLYAIHKSQEREKKKKKKKKHAASWKIRYILDKDDCGCSNIPTTPEEHQQRAIDLARLAHENGDTTMRTDAHIDHHFIHGAQ